MVWLAPSDTSGITRFTTEPFALGPGLESAAGGAGAGVGACWESAPGACGCGCTWAVLVEPQDFIWITPMIASTKMKIATTGMSQRFRGSSGGCHAGRGWASGGDCVAGRAAGG